MKTVRTHFLLIGCLLLWISIQALPELSQNRIDPTDSALFAANGAFFLTIIREFDQLISHPVDWLYSYYNQYPALAVRRHAPVFGISEAIVFLFTGISVFGAKLTAFIYSIAFAVGVYALSYRIWRDALLAVATSFLVMATPQIIWLGTAVRLDLPALAFAVWALFHYIEYSRTAQRSSAIWFALLGVLSIYTYQLAFLFVAPACFHLIILKREKVFTDRTVWIVFLILLILGIPLLAQQFYFAMDNITAATGGEVEEWKRFHPIQDRLSFTNFLYYPIAWWTNYPVQAVGGALWVIAATRRKITKDNYLLLLCGISALAFFTWGRGKDPRYAVYTMIPLALLGVKAAWDLILGTSRNGLRNIRRKVATGIIVALGFVQANAIPTPAYFLMGMEQPVIDILAKDGSARILYSGPRDAAFIFHVRQHDLQRTTQSYRATVQITRSEDLIEFVKKERIDVIAWEDQDDRPDSEGFLAFRNALRTVVSEDTSFVLLGVYQLDYYWAAENQKQIVLHVYTRKGA